MTLIPTMLWPLQKKAHQNNVRFLWDKLYIFWKTHTELLQKVYNDETISDSNRCIQYRLKSEPALVHCDKEGLMQRIVNLMWLRTSPCLPNINTLRPRQNGRHFADDTFKWIFLTHLGRDKMIAISQTISSNKFSWIKMFEFRLKFHWTLFLRVQFTISQHWLR